MSRTKFWIAFCAFGATFAFATYTVHGNPLALSGGVMHLFFLAFWIVNGKQETNEQKAKEEQ